MLTIITFKIDGHVDEVMSVYPLDKKFEAFNCHVINVDGHDYDQLRAALKEARETKGMPTVIVAKTIKGKGDFIYGRSTRMAWSSTK